MMSEEFLLIIQKLNLHRLNIILLPYYLNMQEQYQVENGGTKDKENQKEKDRMEQKKIDEIYN